MPPPPEGEELPHKKDWWPVVPFKGGNAVS